MGVALLPDAGTVAAQGTLPTVSVSDVGEFSERKTWVFFRVSLSAASDEEVTVRYATSSGTATSGSDFKAASGTLTFAPNSTVKSVSVLVYDDSEIEPDETFTVTLTNPTGATLGDATGTATIRNDDTSATLTASNVGETTATLTISGHTGNWWYKGNVHQCTAVPAGTATASISGLTAATAYDYKAYSDSTCATPLDDVKFRTLAPEGTPTVSVSDAQVSEDGTWMRFVVSLSAPSRNPVVVHYATSSGTATSGTDFRAEPELPLTELPLAFHANTSRRKSVHVMVYDDSETEEDETLTLTLTRATGATLGDATATGTIRDDDTRAALTATLTASDVGETTATLTIGGHAGNWWYKGNAHQCTAVPAGTTTVGLTGLTEKERYDYDAYSESTCTTLLAAGAEFVTLWLKVTSLKPTNARLTLFNYRSDRGWWYKGDQSGVACTGPIDGDASITGLDAETTYTYRAYSGAGCNTADELGSEMFTTPATGTTTLSVSDITQTTSTLTIAGHTGAWWAGRTGIPGLHGGNAHLTCTAVASGTTTLALTGLLAGVSHSYSAYSTADCDRADEIARESWFTESPVVSMSQTTGGGSAGRTSLASPSSALGLDVTHQQAGRAAVEGQAIEFTVSLSAATDKEVSVDYATSSGTAESGTDFRAASGTLSIAAHETSATVRVVTMDDSLDEEDETFTLELSNPVRARLGDAVATGTIKDNDETLEPLTASFHDVPASHHGETEFSFELRFSENFPGRLPYRKLRDEALQATNGQVTGARRVTRGQNQRWTITVRPESSDDVTVTLAATTDCAAAGAICTEAGRKLSNTTSATIASESGDTDPARLESAATEEKGRGLILTFTKDILVAGNHADYTVLADGERRTTQVASWEDDTVSLVLAEPVRWGETVTVAYAQPSEGVALRDADDLAIESFGPVAVANTVPRPENTGATGAPTIAGTARAGETLTASTDGIADTDGLSGATFAFQWVSSADGADTDIAGATGASYVLADADVGAAIKVRASFTDDAGNDEELTSSPTAGVEARPLTAEFQGMPAEHDGRRPFSFELVFSENFPGRFPYKTLRDSAFTVTNGSVRSAARVVKGENRRWTISVRPSSNDDVTITLPAGSVSTESGRALSNSPSARVAGPMGISVADARVEEGAGAVLAFAVTLSRAATSALSVDYATSDGTAQAGVDYTAASGTLSFQAGESTKTIEVGVLDDAHDEGEETLTLRLSNASSGQVRDGEATGTIENTDLMPAALLARFGRATAEQVVTHIEERMAAPRQRGFRARFAGRELRPGSEGDFALGFLSQFAPMGTGPAGAVPMGGSAIGSHATGVGAFGGGTAGLVGAMGMSGATGMGVHGMRGTAGAIGTAGRQPMGGAAAMGGYGLAGGAYGGGLFGSMAPGGDPFSNSELELNRESRGGILSVWSRSSRSHFSGMEDALSLNGDVRTTMVGADYSRGALTVGLSVGRTLGLGGYSGPSGGQMSTSMTGFYPWAGYQVSERVSVWGVTGYGTGALSLTPDGASALETGVSMAMTAVGTRGELIGSRATGGFALAFKADAMWVGAASELLDGAAGRLNASEAGVTRVRTALEGSRGFNLGGGRLSLRPSVEVGLRRDGGDAETGAGMDVGGGLAFTDTVTGLSLDVRVRTLVVHQAEGFSERGMSLSFGWDPTPSSPLGLTARVAPSWGGQSRGGAEALWGNQMAYGMGSHQMYGSGDRVDAELGYGLPVGARLVGTPRVGVSTSTYGRDYRFGYGLGVLEQRSLNFELGVDAQRRESPMHGEASNGFLGRASLGW